MQFFDGFDRFDSTRFDSTATTKPHYESNARHHLTSVTINNNNVSTMKLPHCLPLFFLSGTLQTTKAFTLCTTRNRGLLQQRFMASVSGTAYTANTPDAPVVRLFTKEGCTLCDKVKDVLIDIRETYPHSLEQVDITDPEHEHWFSKYKYDIPVLHIGEQFWIKHRIDVEEAIKGLSEARDNKFSERLGEPDAGEMERRQAERKAQE